MVALPWDSARDTCIAEGGDLLVLSTPAKVTFIKEQLTSGEFHV